MGTEGPGDETAGLIQVYDCYLQSLTSFDVTLSPIRGHKKQPKNAGETVQIADVESRGSKTQDPSSLWTQGSTFEGKTGP